MNIPIDAIRLNPYQPRREFPVESLAELGKSILERGLLHPIVVRPLGEKGFELVAGERRWRACKAIGKTQIDATVREDIEDDIEAGITALVENQQREDVDAISMARAMQRLLAAAEKRGQPISQRQLAKQMGMSLGYVRNRLALLATREDVQALVSAHPDTVASALELNKVTDNETRRTLIDRAAKGASYATIAAEVQSWQAEQRWKAEGSRPDAATRKHINAKAERENEAMQQCTAALAEAERHLHQLKSWLPECSGVDRRKLANQLARVKAAAEKL